MEVWDLYYYDGRPAGRTLIRGMEIPKGFYHIVVAALVRHIDGDYLVMQRDYNKIGNPGKYEASAGGSAISGEKPIDAIRRELEEETGINRGRFTSMEIRRDKSSIWHIFLCETDYEKDKIVLQAGETIGYKWLSQDDFIKFIDSDEFIYENKVRLDKYLRGIV